MEGRDDKGSINGTRKDFFTASKMCFLFSFRERIPHLRLSLEHSRQKKNKNKKKENRNRSWRLCVSQIVSGSHMNSLCHWSASAGNLIETVVFLSWGYA